MSNTKQIDNGTMIYTPVKINLEPHTCSSRTQRSNRFAGALLMCKWQHTEAQGYVVDRPSRMVDGGRARERKGAYKVIGAV